MTIRALSRRLRACTRGAMAIEMVIVAPLLALMSLGVFEVGTAVSRQQELQSAASEAESIILAAAGAKPSSATVEQVIEESMGLEASQVILRERFRCGSTAGELIEDPETCEEDDRLYNYVVLELNDRYTPIWANYGIGSAFDYNIVRTILVS